MAAPDSSTPLPLSSNPPVTAAPAPASGAVGLAGQLRLAVVVGLVASLAAWGLIEQFDGYIKLPEGTVPTGAAAMSMMGNAEKTREVANLISQIEYRNILLAIGLTGAAFAGLFGLGEGLARRSAGRAIIGLIAGAVLGGALGTLGGGVLQWVNGRMVMMEVAIMYRTLTMHAIAWGLIGLAVGLATSLPGRQLRTIALTSLLALMGGVLAAVLFIPVSTLLVFMTSANQDLAIPDGTWGRLCWTALAGIAIGLLLGLAREKPALSNSSIAQKS
jgi:hypothetical protein